MAHSGKQLSNISTAFSSGDNKKGSSLPKYVTIAQVSEALKVSTDYVRTLIDKGILVSIKLPGGRNGPIRIPLKSLEKLLTSYKVTIKSPSKRTCQKLKKREVYHGVFSE